MSKRFAIIATLLCCAWPASGLAQDCTIGVYGDPEGTSRWLSVVEAEPFSVYVVLFAEDAVAAAAYRFVYRQQACGPYLLRRFTGPSGNGLTIDEPGGTNAALAECVLGFGARPVVVDEYQFVMFSCTYDPGPMYLEPNTDQDPEFPQYVTCTGITKDCDVGPSARLPVGAEARSFGAIKSLF